MVVVVGEGFMRGHLEHLSQASGVSYAERFLGHVGGPQLSRLLRAAEAVVLPSRWRVSMDAAVVELARHAARPVVTEWRSGRPDERCADQCASAETDSQSSGHPVHFPGNPVSVSR